MKFNKYVKDYLPLLISAFALLLLVFFQNCAKDPTLSDYQTTAASTTPSPTPTPTPTPSVQLPTLIQPANVNVTAGQPVTVVVSGTGTTPTYQWQKGTTNISNTTNQFSLAASVVGDSGTYTLTATNSAGSAAVSFVLSVVAAAPIAPPVITTPPPVIVGTYNQMTGVFNVPTRTTPPFDLVSFTAIATGTNLQYQWYRFNATTGIATPITGATQPTYAFTLISVAQQGNYRLIVTNSAGSVHTDGVLIVEIN